MKNFKSRYNIVSGSLKISNSPFLFDRLKLHMGNVKIQQVAFAFLFISFEIKSKV